ENRLAHAMRWAFRMGFVQTVKGPEETKLLELTAVGRVWLALGREAQYEALFADLRDGFPSKGYPGPADAAFPGGLITAPPGPAPPLLGPRPLRREERQPLRESLFRLFEQLPLKEFYPLEAFLAWAGDPSRNPVLLGRSPRDVTVRDDLRTVP